MRRIKLRKITLLFIILISAILLTACSNNELNNKTNSGEISVIGNQSHNWGDINIKGGKAEHVFSLKNDGKKDLILKGASTSCMCTEARYRLSDNSISPKFGMHNNPTYWTSTIKPGEAFDVEVFFDPMAHGPDAIGPIQRSIFLETSAKNQPILELKASGNVLYEKDYKEKLSNMPL